MSIDKETGIVTLMRGDTLILPVRINEGTDIDPQYRPLRESEKLYFGVMEPGKAFEDAVIKKVLTSENTRSDGQELEILLKPTDTEYLLVGKYYYSVKLFEKDALGNEWVKTIIKPTLFLLEGNNPLPRSLESYQKVDLGTVENKNALPLVTEEDAGKFLRVSAEGVWRAESLVNGNEVAY